MSAPFWHGRGPDDALSGVGSRCQSACADAEAGPKQPRLRGLNTPCVVMGVQCLALRLAGRAQDGRGSGPIGQWGQAGFHCSGSDSTVPDATHLLAKEQETVAASLSPAVPAHVVLLAREDV